jgi:hypothetical protein
MRIFGTKARHKNMKFPWTLFVFITVPIFFAKALDSKALSIFVYSLISISAMQVCLRKNRNAHANLGLALILSIISWVMFTSINFALFMLGVSVYGPILRTTQDPDNAPSIFRQFVTMWHWGCVALMFSTYVYAAVDFIRGLII